ncbi:MAG: ribonuclease Z [Thermoguttaceae bacterium]|jgi:ribonuclease BN (tRNA processing enzyme)
MKLILLGTSGYHPSDRRHTPCLAIPACGVVLDAGTGMYRLGRYLKTDEVDIFLTHAHLDHVIGLTYLFSVIWEHPLRRVTVHGLPEKLDAVEKHLFFPELSVRPSFEAKPLAAETQLADGGRLTHFPLAHPGGSLGFRLDWPGHSMAYITDTTAAVDASYVDKIHGVNLLVHECFYPDSRADLAVKYGHSCLTPALEVARAAGVGRLILTHINPLLAADYAADLSTSLKIFPRTEIGEDLMEVEF